MMHSEYTIRNLAELLETAQAILNEAIADNDGGSIDPSEILIDCDGWDNFTLVARSHTLSDKSVVYDVHIPVKQPEHGPAIIDAACECCEWEEDGHQHPRTPGFSNRCENKATTTVDGTRYCEFCAGDLPATAEPVAERHTINLTPRGLETQEGIKRVNAAVDAFNASAQHVANLATEMVETLARNDQWDSESHDELKAAIKSRRAAQEEFLRSLCGAPPAA